MQLDVQNFFPYGKLRKNISLYEEDMKKIEGIVDKHEGNLSAAMREIIDFIDFMLRKFDNLEEAKKIERRTKGVCIPSEMLNWFLNYTSGCLPDEDAAGSIEEICTIESVSDLGKIAGICFPVETQVDTDDERNPSEVKIRLTGERMYTEFVAKIMACFLAENHGLAVEDVFRISYKIMLLEEVKMPFKVSPIQICLLHDACLFYSPFFLRYLFQHI